MVDTFLDTPPMSPYLFAFALASDFVRASNRHTLNPLDEEDLRVAVWHRPGLEDYAGATVDIGTAVVQFYEEYLGAAYPLGKLDFVAFPDFSIVGMENWGLITYDEKKILFDAVESAEMSRDEALHIVAHEVAHQWFGDLVTTGDFGAVWLNEGKLIYKDVFLLRLIVFFQKPEDAAVEKYILHFDSTKAPFHRTDV